MQVAQKALWLQGISSAAVASWSGSVQTVQSGIVIVVVSICVCVRACVVVVFGKGEMKVWLWSELSFFLRGVRRRFGHCCGVVVAAISNGGSIDIVGRWAAAAAAGVGAGRVRDSVCL
jgi:hypothetical protein